MKSLLACVLIFNATAAGEAIPAGGQVSLITGKSTVVDCPEEVRRLAIANPAVAEVLLIGTKEILVSGVAAGDTSLIVWSNGDVRTLYDVKVESASSPVARVREQLARDFGDLTLDVEGNTVFLRGTVKDQTSADRAELIAGALGKVVNLLYVDVPAAEAQILLKVRFADVDRSASLQLGANLLSTNPKLVGASSTGQFPGPTVTPGSSGTPSTFTLSNALNLFLFRPDIDLGATIEALQSKNILQILAEPNILAIDRKAASFVSGGEFPFPTVQGGANAGAVTISFREFGIRIAFLPTVTPRGTIRLHVTPEVSSLDFSNGLVFQGYTIPALSTRRIDTEVELESGQSFAIAGLLDNQVTKTLSKIPGLGDIPLLGKLFQTYSTTKSNSELLVIVTPELVQPVAAGKTAPMLPMPEKFLDGMAGTPPQTPAGGPDGSPLKAPRLSAVPIEQLRARPAGANSPAGSAPAIPQAVPQAGLPQGAPR